MQWRFRCKGATFSRRAALTQTKYNHSYSLLWHRCTTSTHTCHWNRIHHLWLMCQRTTLVDQKSLHKCSVLGPTVWDNLLVLWWTFIRRVLANRIPILIELICGREGKGTLTIWNVIQNSYILYVVQWYLMYLNTLQGRDGFHGVILMSDTDTPTFSIWRCLLFSFSSCCRLLFLFTVY